MPHVGEIGKFVFSAEVIYRVRSATGCYHDQMNAANFEKRVVPHLLPQPVIALDNTPYHCFQTDKPPPAYAINPDMISWLNKKGNETTQK
jgi:hypothetical protein